MPYSCIWSGLFCFPGLCFSGWLLMGRVVVLLCGSLNIRQATLWALLTKSSAVAELVLHVSRWTAGVQNSTCFYTPVFLNRIYDHTILWAGLASAWHRQPRHRPTYSFMPVSTFLCCILWSQSISIADRQMDIMVIACHAKKCPSLYWHLLGVISSVSHFDYSPGYVRIHHLLNLQNVEWDACSVMVYAYVALLYCLRCIYCVIEEGWKKT